MTEEAQLININGTEYNEADLNDQQKYLVTQIKDLQAKAQTLTFQLDQVNFGLSGFKNALVLELQKSSQEEEEQED